ncbi:DUF4040 domain-containing protein [Herbivorax sp. ANBcel31]|uniref:Na(+)/H(+) antiporter subunit B n=1 Tax=Herbivorax sp. ANBcel31 TaxID=3069754 RepID=UPI0027AE47C8|nr:DUF4040 domain-containing protein [Herbivorax sp. ANBcel31]MDQ2086167.1 DUF4040 domain-containing protein [Herbivorax sp. ANBcel31]
MLLNVFLVLMVLFAVFSVQSDSLRRAVIYLGIFSLVSSFCYLLYGSPDVAIAQAVIGSTLSTILYLVALKKYKIFTIYYTSNEKSATKKYVIESSGKKVIDMLEKFCYEKELEPEVVHSTEKVKNIESKYEYDIIIYHKNKDICVFSKKDSYLVDSMKKYLTSKLDNNLSIVYVKNLF